MPLISIVTPVYNAARWLPETLASVRAQTLTDWEHILVDDGSSDDSVAIVEAAARADSSADSSLHSIAAARIRLLRMERNQGPSMARNLGIDAARGRFIAFLDADDLWLPEKLARSVEWLTAHEYSFVYHDYRHISHDGSLVGALIQAPETLDLRYAAYAPRHRLPDGRDRSRAPARFSFSPELPLCCTRTSAHG